MAAAAFCVVLPLSEAWSNGDEFYRFNALNPKAAEAQVIFAGTVKDTTGKRIADAKVTLSVTVPKGTGEKLVSFNAYTNIAGRYRSFDVGSVVLTLEEIATTVDPETVQVTAGAPGYKMVRAFNRSKPGRKTGVFEIDFTLAPISD